MLLLVQIRLKGKSARLILLHKGSKPFGLSYRIVAIIFHDLLSSFYISKGDGLKIPVIFGLGVDNLTIWIERVVDVVGAIVEGYPSIVAFEIHASVEDSPDSLRVAQSLQLFLAKGTVFRDACRVG